MQVLHRCRHILILKTTTPHLTRIETATPLTSYWASFHSNGASFEKWKKKFDFDVKGDKQQPSKDHIRYVVRQKRAASKKTVKNLLFNAGCSTPRFEESFSKIEANDADRSNKKSRLKPSRHAKGAYRTKVKSKHRREKQLDDFDEHERIFQEKIGERCFTWSFRPWESGFDWRETSGHGYFRNKKYQCKNGMEFEDESSIMGTVADKRILGLPLAGPLKVEDVKAAFRLSALKWHPDKNQDSSRADAEEKFKHCVNAYKSLCSALAVS